MSADSASIIVRSGCPIYFADTLSKDQRQSISQLLDLLPPEDEDLTDSTGLKQPAIIIKNMVDGRKLACPMPLLKTKVALREVAIGESLYVVATDPNSQADISAFCQQSLQSDTAHSLLLVINKATVAANKDLSSDGSKQKVDTIYHFIITKTDSN